MSSIMRGGPSPVCVDDEKVLVWGQTEHGRYLQVVYLVEDDDVLFGSTRAL